MKPEEYVELHARSAFSFLRGGSQPKDLVERAVQLEMPKLAVCDRDGVYGSARMHSAAKDSGLSALVGAELTLDDGAVLPVLVKNRKGYQNLCQLITAAKLRGTKTNSPVSWAELPQYSEGLIALTGDEEGILRDPQNAEGLDQIVTAFGKDNVYVEIQRHLRRGEQWRNETLVALAESRGLPYVATNGVLYATSAERQVLDVFTCIRNHTHLDAAGRLLSGNAERHLKSAQEMTALFQDLPDAISNTARVAERLDFTLENLGYEFPKYNGLSGEAADVHLREEVMKGYRLRYGTPSRRVIRQIKRELDLIGKLGFAGYFLIVWDIVNYCRSHDILVQGRGSAANSVVCYCLGITACDPIAYELLFERFLSEGRGSSWPDIDLDLPSGDRREQAIQEVYQRYGKHGAAMTANVITYRGRSAMREIGKALNLSPDIIDRFSSLFANGDFPHTINFSDQLERAGLPEGHSRAAVAATLYEQIYGLPRHLGQHSGGMIICQNALSSVVPLENASMPGRVVAQWDKDDCEDLGIVKVDLLGLGMMAAMQDIFALCRERQGMPCAFHEIPKEDPAVYEMLQKADTIGTFQVESRAQMATLPRFLPKRFYDIVMQVAIIRPGPIQGGMLSALMARREGKEKVTYLDDRLKPTLERTLGVPLFQEQLLKMAMDIGGFSGSEAEELRRALSFHRSHERMDAVCEKLRIAMAEREVLPAVADQIVKNIQSFAVYGFPESHAISFALIAYASCWLKAHRAPEFYAALLNNQPMGFYSSSTLIQDARARDVKVRPVSVLHSDWDCIIELDDAVRLGLRMVRGMDAAIGQRIAEERKIRQFASLEDFRRRVEPDRPALRVLSRIGALNGLVAHRRDGLWKSEFPLRADDLPGFHLENEQPSPLPAMNAFERLEADFAGTGVTTGKHPMALVRPEFPDVTRAGDLPGVSSGQQVRIAGLVICRQRPGTAKGVVFVSLEDETGVANAILYAPFFEKNRLVVTQERFLIIDGTLQNERGTIHIMARRVQALHYEACATPGSHDFR
jgi:error-prone DNA polymerase